MKAMYLTYWDFSTCSTGRYRTVAEVLQTLARNIGRSELWNEGNVSSLIAVVSWSFEHDIDLDNWLADYCSRTDSYFDNQVRNFEIMREDLEIFIKQTAVA